MSTRSYIVSFTANGAFSIPIQAKGRLKELVVSVRAAGVPVNGGGSVDLSTAAAAEAGTPPSPAVLARFDFYTNGGSQAFQMDVPVQPFQVLNLFVNSGQPVGSATLTVAS